MAYKLKSYMEQYLITPEGILVSSLEENEEIYAIEYFGEDVEEDILLLEKFRKRKSKRNNGI